MFPAQRYACSGKLCRALDCLVTGGAGFIGSNLVDGLIARGDRVAVIDNLSTGKRDNLESALARGASCTRRTSSDAGAISDIFAAVKPELSFHLAAQIDVRHSVEDPTLDAKSNVLGTISVLEAARGGHQADRVQLDRRRAVRRRRRVPDPGGLAIRPLAPYGQGKLAAEGYCGLVRAPARALHGLASLRQRLRAQAGRPRRGRRGRDLLRRLVEGRTPIVFGDGPQTRDWVEVGDVVRANLIAAESAMNGAVNIGAGSRDLGARSARRAARGGRRPVASRADVRARPPGRSPAELFGRDPGRRGTGLESADGTARRTGKGVVNVVTGSRSLPPPVTVAIPTLNAGDRFRQTLAGVRAQRLDREFELLICDSGSSDDTVALARRHGARVITIPRERLLAWAAPATC